MLLSLARRECMSSRSVGGVCRVHRHGCGLTKFGIHATCQGSVEGQVGSEAS